MRSTRLPTTYVREDATQGGAVLELSSGMLPSTSAVVGVLATALLLVGIFLLPAKEHDVQSSEHAHDRDTDATEDRADSA